MHYSFIGTQAFCSCIFYICLFSSSYLQLSNLYNEVWTKLFVPYRKMRFWLSKSKICIIMHESVLYQLKEKISLHIMSELILSVVSFLVEQGRGEGGCFSQNTGFRDAFSGDCCALVSWNIFLWLYRHGKRGIRRRNMLS